MYHGGVLFARSIGVDFTFVNLFIGTLAKFIEIVEQAILPALQLLHETTLGPDVDLGMTRGDGCEWRTKSTSVTCRTRLYSSSSR